MSGTTRPTISLALDSGSTSASMRDHLVADERLLLEQRPREAVESGPMLGDQADRLHVGVVGEAGLLLVAHALGLLGQRVVVGAHRPRDDALRHPVLEDHRAGQLGHLLEVVRGAVRDAAEHDLLGGAAGERDLHPVDELLPRVQVAVLLGEVERVAEGLAARDDRRLVHGEALAHQVRHERVAALVVGEDPLLLLGHDLALLEAGDDPLHGVVEVDLADVLLVVAAGEDRGLVGDVGEVGAGEAGGLAGDRGEVDVGGERLAARVHLQDRLAAGEVGRRARAPDGRSGRDGAGPGRGPEGGSRRP